MWPRVSCLHSRGHQRLKEKQTNEEIKGEIISTIRVYPLKNRYTFPQSIAVTHERPEIISWNASSVHMVELTIPLETGAENAGAIKQIRNAELVDSGTQGQLSSHTQPLRLVQEGSFMSPVSHKFTQ